jgi:hypothetical protein
MNNKIKNEGQKRKLVKIAFTKKNDQAAVCPNDKGEKEIINFLIAS